MKHSLSTIASLAAAALLAAGAPAQTKPAAKPGAAAAKPGTGARPAGATQNIPGVSAEGNAILTKIVQQGDPALLDLVRQQRALRDQLAPALMAQTVNVDQVGTLLHQAEVLRAQIQEKQVDRLISAAKQLPEADRGPFLRAVAVSSSQGGRAPQP